MMSATMSSYQPLLLTMKDFPFYKMGYDILLMMRKVAYLIFFFGGARMTGIEETDELYFNLNGTNHQLKSSLWNACSLMVLLFLTAVTSVFIGVSAISISFLPIWIMIPIAMWFSPLIIWALWPPSLCAGTGDNSKYREEKWFYINGIAINGWWNSQIQKRLQSIFGRPITMIENKTFGLVCDIASIIMLRNFQYPTNTFRLTYNTIKASLMDDSCKRVVLMSHSEGAIIAQMVVDRLLIEMDNNMLAKLEIYTFGSAADKFEDGQGRIPVVEHFANWYDYIAQVGVLNHKMIENAKHYCGNLYVSDHFGHWFSQHYSRGITDKAFKSKDGKVPRLYNYIGGGFPTDQSH